MALCFLSLGLTISATQAETELGGSQFHITTTPALPEFSILPEQYRIGLANLISREFLMYVGERIYVWQWTQTQNTSHMKIGLNAGIHVGLFLETGSKFQFDTEDGYFGLLWEWAFETWGLGAGFGHHSAHVGDGRFRTLTPVGYNQNFWSLRGAWYPHPQIEFEIATQLYSVDTPQQRTAETHVAMSFYPWPQVSIEGYVAADNLPRGADVARLKISGLFPGRDPEIPRGGGQVIPYVLIHHGKHIFGQRYGENVGLTLLAGLEFSP